MQTLEWFKNKIGERIHRDSYKCCIHCEDVNINGLIVANEQHAIYLFDTQNDFASEGVNLNYQ